jgi:CubicO group peptidase (beta-lactamase class C family)
MICGRRPFGAPLMSPDARLTRRRFACSLGTVGAAWLAVPWRTAGAAVTEDRDAKTVSASAQLRLLGPQLVAILRRHINLGYTPGAIALVALGDALEVVAAGEQSRETAAPLRTDSLFRISSMTKPVTAAAAMMLVQDGRLRLHDAVERWLPELARRRVLRDIGAELDDTVRAKRPITVEDLLSFRCGLGILPSPPDAYPIQRRISELKLVGFGPPDPASPLTPDEWLKRLGTLPLMAQPGEQWLYNTGAYILGVLLARASGTSLPELLSRRVFEPLGMKDTGFFVPASQLSRLVSAYRLEAGRAVLYDAPSNSAWHAPPAFPDGGAGLVSTADDYLAFSRFLLARGRVAGRALLAESAVDAMTRDQLTAAQRAAGAPILGTGRGWGLGLSVVAQGAVAGLPAGSFGWNGGLGTTWLAERYSGRTVIVLTQTMFSSPAPPALHQEVWRAVFAPAVV